MSVQDDIGIREFASPDDYRGMISYFHDADDAFLHGMGVDRAKLPPTDEWLVRCLEDARRLDDQRDRCYVAWCRHDEVVGHSSLSHISSRVAGHIHLHLWRRDLRRAGLGAAFFAMSVDYFFERFALERVVCEPSADNPAPNAVLERLGFSFVRRYRTMPVSTSFEQDVNRYEITREARAQHRKRRVG